MLYHLHYQIKNLKYSNEIYKSVTDLLFRYISLLFYNGNPIISPLTKLISYKVIFLTFLYMPKFCKILLRSTIPQIFKQILLFKITFITIATSRIVILFHIRGI